MSPRWTIGAVAALALAAWALTDSAAAGVICLGYGFAGAQALARGQVGAKRAKARAESLELLASAAADLRAGAVAVTLALPDRELDRLATAARRVSQRTGAPLADLLDRLEQQQTALSRLDSAARAQSAGLRASAALLLCLPLVGVGLGHLIGANALDVLLHTRVGQACAAAAVALQLGGLAWTDRLARTSMDSGAVRVRHRTLSRAVPPSPMLATTPAGEQSRFAALMGRGSSTAVSGFASLVRRGPAAVAAARSRPAAHHGELAVAADLIAASLRAGAPVSASVLAVGETLAGPLSASLLRIGRELQLGVSPEEAWQPLAAIAPAARVVAAARRSAQSGAALSGALTRCADALRADAEHDRLARAQRAAVFLVLPLGLCFLPAFVLAGLLPVVLSVLREVL